jgi:uncharacterized membrane protein YfcA
MQQLIPFLDPEQFILALSIAVLAGMIKGMVGFALPMVLVSGLSTFLSPELALAGLILPTLVTNWMQALRQGFAAAWKSVQRFRVFLIFGLVFLLCSAQLIRVLPQPVLFLVIGVPITIFAVLQLLGVRFSLARPTWRVEAAIGGFAGLIGGMSGIWGPPTVAYLTALNTEKREQMRVQGVIYGLGAMALFAAHIGSGVVRAETVPFSVVLVVPAVLGMWVGAKFQDKIDQVLFRKATLLVLLIAGLNLVRRGLTGG